MTVKAQLQLMAQYNRWMNNNILLEVSNLDPDAVYQDLGAFFKSIGGTLNHILVGDIIWLKRYMDHSTTFSSLTALSKFEQPQALDQLLHQDISRLAQSREEVDRILVDLCDEVTDYDLDQSLTYKNTGGEIFSRPFGALMLHLFNHQTHHRGQITTLLNQSGVDPGVTDLLKIIPIVGP
ncbi:MAG: DinB family protein [bacterium]